MECRQCEVCRKTGIYLYFYCSNLIWFTGKSPPHSLPVGEIKTGYIKCTLFGEVKLEGRKWLTSVIGQKISQLSCMTWHVFRKKMFIDIQYRIVDIYA